MGRYDRELHRLWANVNQWAEYDGELNGPMRALAQRAFNTIWANSILSTGLISLHQRPTRAFRFSRQSSTYKFCGPAHPSCMTENSIVDGPMRVNSANMMANKMGSCRCLRKSPFILPWANSISSTEAAHFHSRPMREFRFGRQSATYKLCGPTRRSGMTANCRVDRLM